MSDDPFADTSPWDEPNETPATETPKESPVTTAPTAMNPFKIGLTFKAASGFDAEWITPTVYGGSADEVARRTVELIGALKEHGVIELASKAAEYTRGQYKGAPSTAKAAPKRFEGGKVVTQDGGAPEVVNDDCPHGRKHFAKDTWEAMFCTARDRADQCPPAFKDKKTGKYVVKS
ncbi:MULTISPECIES: hypothetical protein [Streptomyces]|uniref:hypothetical protein n=1 Tax=Streptomyces TaxID=1883 RepID=UPI001E45B31D|nr:MULTISPECIES: hypothetical protein [Streptomyces]UFQ16387.1 hypothetical protein J2N69_16030 [Streptomyces huasconensis]WCL85990.1 hypothetical protein PPN52_16040 [Streptomyces sp. JCM 35825]